MSLHWLYIIISPYSSLICPIIRRNLNEITYIYDYSRNDEVMLVRIDSDDDADVANQIDYAEVEARPKTIQNREVYVKQVQGAVKTGDPQTERLKMKNVSK